MLKEKLMSWWNNRFGVDNTEISCPDPPRESDAEMRVRLEKETRAEIENKYRTGRRDTGVLTNPNFLPITTRRTREEIDIRDQVRKWGINFDGRIGLQDFIERVDELCESYGINGAQIVQCIPILLKDKALLWYRNNKQNWNSWEDFVKDLKLFYMPAGVDIQLEEEIRNRTQGLKEPAKEYITKLQTLMRRHGQMSESARLERLYHNLRLEYKKYIKRIEFQNVNGLIQLADAYEQTLIQEATYKPPKTQSVMLETIYLSNQTKKRKDTETIMVNEYEHQFSCWKCGEKGHMQNGCRKPRVRLCIYCGKKNI